MPRISRSRTSARTRKCFSPCMPGSTKWLPRSALDRELAVRRLLLLVLEHGGERRARLADAEGLDLHLALRRLPARAAARLALMRRELGRQPELRAGGAVLDHAPADALAPVLGRGGERLRSLAVSTPVSRKPRSFWNALHRRDRAVAEFAVGLPGVVVGPVEVELDRGALGDRHAGIGARAPAALRLLGSRLCLAGASFALRRGLLLLLASLDRARSVCACADAHAGGQRSSRQTRQSKRSAASRRHAYQPLTLCNAPQQP